MKKIIVPALCLSMLCLAACHKDPVKGPGTTSDTTTNTGTLKIDLINSERYTGDTAKFNVELIISEPTGKILLDTITQAGARVTASLSTNAALVYVTNISASGGYFAGTTYIGVNPSAWAGDYTVFAEFPTGPKPASLPYSTLTYTNVQLARDIMFSQNFGYGFSQYQIIPDTVIEKYVMVPGNYAYFLCPDAARYNMTIPTQNNETIDCSTMDTAVSTNLTYSSSYYSFTGTILYGYTDTTNLNSIIGLYNIYAVLNPNLPQVEYPAKKIQKYAMEVEFDHSGEDIEIYSCSNTFNPNLAIPAPNAYSLADTQNTAFSVTWNVAKPTYYYTHWQGANISWLFYAPADSGSFNPIGLITAQRSKLLQGQSLTQLSLNEIQYGTINGYNYGSYLGLTNDSTKLQKTLISGSTTYSKLF